MVTDNLKELTQALTAVEVRGRIIELLSKIHQLEDSDYSLGIILRRAGIDGLEHILDKNILKALETYYKANYIEIDYEKS